MSEPIKRSRISFCTTLLMVFVTLKLTGNIAWSWWWVLSPLWIPWAIVIPFLGLLGLAAVVIDQN